MFCDLSVKGIPWNRAMTWGRSLMKSATVGALHDPSGALGLLLLWTMAFRASSSPPNLDEDFQPPSQEAGRALRSLGPPKVLRYEVYCAAETSVESLVL